MATNYRFFGCLLVGMMVSFSVNASYQEKVAAKRKLHDFEKRYITRVTQLAQDVTCHAGLIRQKIRFANQEERLNALNGLQKAWLELEWAQQVLYGIEQSRIERSTVGIGFCGPRHEESDNN
jgi:hypothetical protein